jgi:hypothetical protein
MRCPSGVNLRPKPFFQLVCYFVELCYQARLFLPMFTHSVLPMTCPNTRYQAGRYPLLGPDLHRLDRTSFTWRTHSITSSAMDDRFARPPALDNLMPTWAFSRIFERLRVSESTALCCRNRRAF